jgi:HD-GYP domain-containing protein (c-di-GMP phosphodiesterase class II)
MIRCSGDWRHSSATPIEPADSSWRLTAELGLMQLVNARTPSGEVAGFDREVVLYIEALAGDAAVALDLRRLLKAQKDLLESFIHVLAGTIDAKSPYTHGHCQRVPEAANLLAAAAHESDHGPFADFRLTEDEWYELYIASWLHDCGKVTTPEPLLADVFEALTAVERPYMRPKTLSTAIRIMGSMRDRGHLCPDLFELFLTSGVYLEYGKRHLKPEQLDEVDIAEYVEGGSS